MEAQATRVHPELPVILDNQSMLKGRANIELNCEREGRPHISEGLLCRARSNPQAHITSFAMAAKFLDVSLPLLCVEQPWSRQVS